jgi:hypothetical protein
MITENFELVSVKVRRVKNFLSVDECNQVRHFALEYIMPQMVRDFELVSGNGLFIGGGVKHRSILDFIDQNCKLNIVERIQQVVNDYSNQENFKDSKVTHSWMYWQNKGGYLKYHNHLRPVLPENTEFVPTVQGILAGALYINVPEGSSNLEVVNPVEHHKDIIKKQPKTIFEPETGSLLLFPCYLLHGGESVNNVPQRIVIGFGTIGEKT